MNKRSAQARQALTEKRVTQSGPGEFRVYGDASRDGAYETVRRTGAGLKCGCADHAVVGSDCAHIKAALMFSCRNMGYNNETFRIMGRTEIMVCKFCDSGDIRKKGFKATRQGRRQRYGCRECGRTFMTAAAGFEGMRHPPEVITASLQMYHSKMSVRRIAAHWRMVGTDVSYRTVYSWVAKFGRMVAEYLNDVVPRMDGRPLIRADEVWTKFSGVMHYLFASMDDSTRFLLAAEVAGSKFEHDAGNLLMMTRTRMGGRVPAHFITDGLPAYGRAARRVFGRSTNHVADAGIRSTRTSRTTGRRLTSTCHPTNNRMERWNGEYQDWIAPKRGLKDPDTALIPGMVSYYNHLKPHSALGGRTPGEAALIEIEGRNKWVTLIQNAALHRAHSA